MNTINNPPTEFYNNKQVKLGFTVCIILFTAVAFTAVEVSDVYPAAVLSTLPLQGVMEYKSPYTLPCDDFEFFTHGGMIFLFTTSMLFSIVSPYHPPPANIPTPLPGIPGHLPTLPVQATQTLEPSL